MLIVLGGHGVAIKVAVSQMSHSPIDEMQSGKNRDGNDCKDAEHFHPTRRPMGQCLARFVHSVMSGVGALAQVGPLSAFAKARQAVR